jgi:hypothetical protein
MFAVKREELIRSLNILSHTAPHAATGQECQEYSHQKIPTSFNFLPEKENLPDFPFGLGYSRRSAPAARSPPIDEAAQGDYRSIA